MNLPFKNLLQAAAIMLIGFFTGHLIPKSKAAALTKNHHEIAKIEFDGVKKAVIGKTAWIVDARSAYHFQQGHIPGATNLAAKCSERELKEFAAAAKKTGKPVIVYCSDAACPDSDTLAVRLNRTGELKITTYKEGWEEWKILEPTN